MKIVYGILFLISWNVSAQEKQPIPRFFLDRMISNGKLWKAKDYSRVQVSGSTNKINSGSIIFLKKNKVLIVTVEGEKLDLTYHLEPGVVDPILVTSDKKKYEVRFFNQPPIEIMRLRCVEGPSKIYYLEDISYMH